MTESSCAAFTWVKHTQQKQPVASGAWRRFNTSPIPVESNPEMQLLYWVERQSSFNKGSVLRRNLIVTFLRLIPWNDLAERKKERKKETRPSHRRSRVCLQQSANFCSWISLKRPQKTPKTNREWLSQLVPLLSVLWHCLSAPSTKWPYLKYSKAAHYFLKVHNNKFDGFDGVKVESAGWAQQAKGKSSADMRQASVCWKLKF